MRASWRNLDWIEETDQAEIISQITSWAVGEYSIDRVDFVCEAVPQASGSRVRTRILGKVGKAQITVVRDAASSEESFQAAFVAFEDSARWTLEQVRTQKMGVRPAPPPVRTSPKARTSSKPVSKPVRKPTPRSSRRRRAKAGSARWSRRIIPVAAVVAGVAVVGTSTVDPLAWVELRFGDDSSREVELAFSATAQTRGFSVAPESFVADASAFSAIAGSDLLVADASAMPGGSGRPDVAARESQTSTGSETRAASGTRMSGTRVSGSRDGDRGTERGSAGSFLAESDPFAGSVLESAAAEYDVVYRAIAGADEGGAGGQEFPDLLSFSAGSR